MNYEDRKIWKLRTVKEYHDAHNHILVGQVLESNSSYIRLHCKSYHFGKVVNSAGDIREGCLMVRIIPWDRVEIINELPNTFTYANAKVTKDTDGTVLLKDDTYVCSLVYQYDRRY
jgi:hypothetical protein